MSGRSNRAPSLVLDLQGTQSVDHAERGIGRYVANHALALSRIAGAVKSLVVNPTLPFPGHLPPDLLINPRLTWGTATQVSAAVGASGSSAYHVMSPFELGRSMDSLLPPFAGDLGLPLVVTLYDLIPLLMSERYLREPEMRRRYMERLEIVARADLVLAISAHTRADAIAHAGIDPDRIVAIGGGVSPFFSPADDGVVDRALLRRELPDVKQPFVLCVSGGDDRKNTEALVAAFAMLPARIRSEHQLVIACDVSPSMAAAWRLAGTSAGLEGDRLVLSGRIADETLRALYRCATLFVFPSLYEGFGLPVAEAIACGCPAITSTASSLPEVLDWPAATFDPTQPAAMSALIQRALDSTEFRSELQEVARRRRPEHTWDAVALRTVAALKRLSRPARRGARGERRLRIALAGFFPPAAEPIAARNAGLARALAARSHVDILHPEGAQPAPIDGCRSFSLDAFGGELNPHAYDAIVYLMANTAAHGSLLDAIGHWPGVVWLQEANLRTAFIAWAKERPSPDWRELVRREVARAYGPRVPRDPHRLPLPDVAFERGAAEQAGLFMTGPVVRSARLLVTSTDRDAKLLRLEHGPNAWLPEVVVIGENGGDEGAQRAGVGYSAAAERLLSSMRELRLIAVPGDQS